MKAAIGFTDLTAGDWQLKVLQPEGTLPIEESIHVK